MHLFDSCAFVSALLMVSLEAPATQSTEFSGFWECALRVVVVFFRGRAAR